MTREKVRVLRDSGVGAAGISIDSLDAAKHDAFRGVPGAWQRAMNGVDACHEAGIDVLVHTTALKMNQQEIPDIVRFAHENGARAFHLFFLVCTGRGEQLTDLSPQEYERLLSFVLDAQDRYSGMMVRARCAPYIGRLAMERGTSLLWSAGCLAGTSYCRITPTGDVTPCPYLPTKAGNVRERDFGAIWESSPSLALFRAPQRQLSGKCGQCAFSQGDEAVCVGCRARAFSLAGDALAADPWCLFQPGSAADTLGSNDTPSSLAPKATDVQVQVVWADDAQERLSRIPFFIRGRVRQSAEAYARQRGLTEVTPEVLEHLRQRAYGHPGKAPSSASTNNAVERKQRLL